MLRRLFTVSRNVAVMQYKCPKQSFINSVRSNADLASVLKSHNAKSKQKEAGEIYKWILLMLPVTSFGLGCWQVYRLRWKLELIDIMQSKSKAAPVPMPENFEKLETMEYMPVKVRGEFLHDKEFLIGPRALIDSEAIGPRSGSLISDPKTNQGWLVVTPFKLQNGEVILVNRGWIPQSMRPKEKRQSSMVKGEVELVGVVRLSEKRAPFMPKNNPQKNSWFSRDLEQMSAHLGCAPVWLDARGIPDPPEGWPLPNQTRVTLRNEHLSYIVTWYSLSIFTGLMWHRYFIRKLPLL